MFLYYIKFVKYVFSACGNWDNYDSNKLDNNNAGNRVEDNNGNENMGKNLLDNLYKLYGVYN